MWFSKTVQTKRRYLCGDLKLHNNRPPARESISQTTGPRWHGINDAVNLLLFKQFSLPYTPFEACGAVFIVNSKMHLRKISWNEYFKAHFCIISVLIQSRASRPIDAVRSRAETGQFLIQRRSFDPSVTSIGGERNNSLWVSLGVTWITKVQITMSGKSKVLMVKSRTETHFRKTNISLDLSSRNGPNCSNVICKMLLWSKLIRGTQRPFSGKWSEIPRYASWSALKTI